MERCWIEMSGSGCSIMRQIMNDAVPCVHERLRSRLFADGFQHVWIHVPNKRGGIINRNFPEILAGSVVFDLIEGKFL